MVVIDIKLKRHVRPEDLNPKWEHESPPIINIIPKIASNKRNLISKYKNTIIELDHQIEIIILAIEIGNYQLAASSFGWAQSTTGRVHQQMVEREVNICPCSDKDNGYQWVTDPHEQFHFQLRWPKQAATLNKQAQDAADSSWR